MVHVSRRQRLRVLPGGYVIERSVRPVGAAPEALSVIDGPDGRTVVRRDDEAAAAWAVLWSGEEPHDPQATGMLHALVGPLAEAAIPVMVCSTFTADLVLVPAQHLEAAVAALRDAGHEVAG